LPNGNLDTTFSLDGRVTFSIGGLQRVASLLPQSAGKLVVVGDGNTEVSSVSSKNIVLFRLKDDGSLDPFVNEGNSNGFFEIDFGGSSDWVAAATVQKDGKLVVAATTDFAGSDDFTILRFLSNGLPDSSFQGPFYDLINVSEDQAYAVAIQKLDGRMILAGTTNDGTGTDIALTRTHAFVSGGANINLLGTTGADVLMGTSGNNVIEGLLGADSIHGFGGNDRICGGLETIPWMGAMETTFFTVLRETICFWAVVVQITYTEISVTIF